MTRSGGPAEGWYKDPTGHHAERWFSVGLPTALVRDGQRTSDDPLSEAEARAAASCELQFVDLPISEPAHEIRRRPLHLDNPVEIPGGIIGSDPYRRWGPVVRWLLVVPRLYGMAYGGVMNTPGFNKRDVVIVDASRTEEFYRQGPFSANHALVQQKAIARTVDEIGLPEFLRQAQIKASAIGRVTRPGDTMGLDLALEIAQKSQEAFRLWVEGHFARKRDSPKR